MLTDKKFTEMLKKLLEKSRMDQVTWRTAYSGGYEVAFSADTVIDVQLSTPHSDLDWGIAKLIVNGNDIIRLEATDNDTESDTFELIRDLYVEAHRSVVGWDKALDQIEKELNSDKRVGLPATVPDDHVPF